MDENKNITQQKEGLEGTGGQGGIVASTTTEEPKPVMPAPTTAPVTPNATFSNSPTPASTPMGTPTTPLPPPTQPGPNPPVQPKKGGSYLSGKTTALILALAAIALFFLFLAITPHTPTQPTTALKITPTPANETILTLESLATTPSAIPAKTATVNVMVDTHKNAVNVVQLELAFDPTVISNITVTPGTFFKDPVELTKGLDAKNGRLSYALGISPTDNPVKGQGTFATLSIQFQPTATAASTIISFLPKTLVGASGMNGSALKSAKSLEVTVPGVTPAVKKLTTSPSASQSSSVSR